MIAFGFSFPGGFYHATPWGRHANEADVAWPPEPVRILRSLIAAWFRKADQARFPKRVLDDLVDALAAEPPLFSLPEAVHSHMRAFMPAPADKKLIYDAFLRLDRDAEVIAAWPTVVLDSDTSALAAHLMERLGYLGRAESWVIARILKNSNGEFNARPRALKGKEIIDADGVVLTDQTSESSTPVEVVAVLPPKAWASLLAEKRPELRDMKPTQRRLVASTLLDRLADAIAVDTAEWHAAGWSSPRLCRRLSTIVQRLVLCRGVRGHGAMFPRRCSRTAPKLPVSCLRDALGLPWRKRCGSAKSRGSQ